MTRKQELYQHLIKEGFVSIRNHLSICHSSWWRIAPWRWRRQVWLCYQVAQFLHNLPPLIQEPGFTEADIWFLNQTRIFFERIGPPSSYNYQYFFSTVRQIFNLIPPEMKSRMEWDGPQLPEMTPERLREANEFLWSAIETNNNIETLRNALVIGADLHARNPQGQTALVMAKELGKDDYVRELREAGAEE